MRSKYLQKKRGKSNSRLSRGRVYYAIPKLGSIEECLFSSWVISPRHINAQAKHVLIIMEIGLGYFYVLLPPNTITKMVELAARLKTPILFLLLLLLLFLLPCVLPNKALSLFFLR